MPKVKSTSKMKIENEVNKSMKGCNKIKNIRKYSNFNSRLYNLKSLSP